MTKKELEQKVEKLEKRIQELENRIVYYVGPQQDLQSSYPTTANLGWPYYPWINSTWT